VSNPFRLLLTQAAFWLMIRVRLAAQGTELAKAQVPRLWIHLASSCPYKELLLLLNKRLQYPLRI
jgi:hypothetical protein